MNLNPIRPCDGRDNCSATPPPRPKIRVRRSKSALLYLRVQDARRSEEGRKCGCARCLGQRLGKRDRRYGFPKRYGLKTTVTTRRVDRVDPVRKLY